MEARRGGGGGGKESRGRGKEGVVIKKYIDYCFLCVSDSSVCIVNCFPLLHDN